MYTHTVSAYYGCAYSYIGTIHWEGIETGPLLTVGTSSTQILTLKNYFH